MKRFTAIFLCLFFLSGCASFGQWSDTAKTKLDAFGIWADAWIGGALKTAPLIIAAVASFTGQTNLTTAASDAVTAAQATLGTYHAVVAAGSGDTGAAQAAVVAAIEQVKTTVGAVKEVIGDVSYVDPTGLSRYTMSIIPTSDML